MYIKEEIRDIASSFQRARVLLTGIELGVFSAIRDEAKTSEQISAALGTDPRATDRLLNALCAMELLGKKKNLFTNTPESRKYLVQDSEEYLSGLMHMVNLWDRWTHLTDTIRQGTPAPKTTASARSSAWIESFIGAMHDRGRAQGQVLASDLDLSAARTMLDVGGGSGDFAMAFVVANEEMTATVFDLPDVIPLTERYIANRGLGSRVQTVAGNFHTDPLPSGYDLVLLSAIVHMNSREENRALVKKCAAALNHSGRLIILDHIMTADRTKPAAGTLFALNMLVGTQSGDTYTDEEIRSWLDAAGLLFLEQNATPFGISYIIGLKL